MCKLGAHAKFWNPTTTLSGILTTGTRRKEKKKSGITPKIVSYLSLLHWSHALRSDQKYVILAGGCVPEASTVPPGVHPEPYKSLIPSVFRPYPVHVPSMFCPSFSTNLELKPIQADSVLSNSPYLL